jgi:hypothetical protein
MLGLVDNQVEVQKGETLLQFAHVSAQAAALGRLVLV